MGDMGFPRLVVIFVLLSSRPRNLLIGSLVSFANVRRTSGRTVGPKKRRSYGSKGWTREGSVVPERFANSASGNNGISLFFTPTKRYQEVDGVRKEKERLTTAKKK